MKKYLPTTLKTEIDWSNLAKWEIPFGLNGLIMTTFEIVVRQIEMYHKQYRDL